MYREFKTFRNLKTKFIFDQLTIIANEILNLMSITNYLKTPIVRKKAELFEKYYERVEATKRILDEADGEDKYIKLERIIKIVDEIITEWEKELKEEEYLQKLRDLKKLLEDIEKNKEEFNLEKFQIVEDLINNIKIKDVRFKVIKKLINGIKNRLREEESLFKDVLEIKDFPLFAEKEIEKFNTILEEIEVEKIYKNLSKLKKRLRKIIKEEEKLQKIKLKEREIKKTYETLNKLKEEIEEISNLKTDILERINKIIKLIDSNLHNLQEEENKNILKELKTQLEGIIKEEENLKKLKELINKKIKKEIDRINTSLEKLKEEIKSFSSVGDNTKTKIKDIISLIDKCLNDLYEDKNNNSFIKNIKSKVIENVNLWKPKDINQRLENLKEKIEKSVNDKESIRILQNLLNEKLSEEEKKLLEIRTDEEIEILILALIHLYKRINILRYYLKKTSKEIENTNISLTEELIIFSFFNSKIREFLQVLNLISRSLTFKKENAGQPYIPSPLLDRRYRLYNLQKSTKEKFLNVISNFVKENEKFFEDEFTKRNRGEKTINFILTSDYEIGDSVYRNSLDIALIKGSFFWREMGRNYPIMIHEIMHKVVNFIREDIKEELAKLSEGIYTFLYRRAFFGDIGNPLFNKDHLDELTEDIIIDLFTFLIFGDAYILALLLHGGLGFKFYDTLVKDEDKNSFLLYKRKNQQEQEEEEEQEETKSSNTGINSKDEENNFYSKIEFTYIPTQINFQQQRDSTLIRIRFLFKIRKFLKNYHKYIEETTERERILNNMSVISEDLEYIIKQYINDLFPIFSSEDLPYTEEDKKNKNIKFISRTYSFMSEPQKATTELISAVIKVVSEEFFIFFVKKIKNEKLKFIGKFWDLYYEDARDKSSFKDAEKGKFYFFVETEEKENFKIVVNTSLKDREKEEGDIAIEQIEPKNRKKFKDINIINFIWKVSIKLAKVFPESLCYDVPEGRILRGYSNVMKHTYLVKKLLEKKGKVYNGKKILNLHLDDAIFVKSRKIYDNNKSKIRENLQDLFPKNIVESLALGPFDTCVLRNQIKKVETTKKLEEYLYKPIISNHAFIDRHSLLKVESDEIQEQNTDGIWKAFILIRFSQKVVPYRKKLLELEIEEIDINEENKKGYYEKFINYLVEKFFAFSLGWEDIILKIEGTLEEIFNIKEKLQEYKTAKLKDENGERYNLIDRTETIIFFPLKEKKNKKLDTEKRDYKMFINIRVREEKKVKEEFLNKKNVKDVLNLREIEGNKFNVFLYPGIYDINLSNSELTEKTIEKIINKILDTNPIFVLGGECKVLDAEDVVIHITKEIK